MRAQSGDEAYWVYELPVKTSCTRCESSVISNVRSFDRKFWSVLIGAFALYYRKRLAKFAPLTFVGAAAFVWKFFRPRIENIVKVPLPVSLVGALERGIHSASVSTKGGDMKAHSHFINELSYLGISEERKQALCAWAPCAMMGYMSSMENVMRTYSPGRPSVKPGSPLTNPEFRGNPDVEDGQMLGTRLDGDEYGEEDRVTANTVCKFDKEGRVLAYQTGPDLIPTETMDNTEENMKAGLAKRVKPLPFKADAKLIRRVEKTVSAMISHVFTKEKIIAWRNQNPDFDEFGSKKWSNERWHRAVEAALTDVSARIKQEFQIKQNEALPAKGKAPRPIIQTGDQGQIIMSFAVKCFEEILFHHFEDASIKHCAKYDAMKRVAKHLSMKDCNMVEGDGSAWDACCNSTIRKMTENRIIRHIVNVLGDDPQVPQRWMDELLRDMDKDFIKGKFKQQEAMNPVRVLIESIRQSGHRGTSCFNWLINYVCWISVLSDSDPKNLMPKWNEAERKYDLPTSYKTLDGDWKNIRFAFEGDDSIISTTEILNQERIEKLWTSLGFRMKLVFAKDKFTFTGFDFSCNENGPTGTFLPEIARNIASSSWSTSSELKSHPDRVHKVGAAAFLARAEMFKDCGPLSKYFAEIGLSHVRRSGDFGLEESEAVRLGIAVSHSVQDELLHLSAAAQPMNSSMKSLVKKIVPDFSKEHELRCLTCTFDEPTDLSVAKVCIPYSIWDPENFEVARR